MAVLILLVVGILVGTIVLPAQISKQVGARRRERSDAPVVVPLFPGAPVHTDAAFPSRMARDERDSRSNGP